MNLSINPALTSNAAGSFSVTSGGYIQGTAQDDPAVRFYLASAPLNANETLPMWGGCGIFETTALDGSATYPRRTVGRATSLTQTASGGLIGFSVFDQDYSMVTSPQSETPAAFTGMSIHFYRLGSGARIAVAIQAGLAATLAGGSVGQQVSWDFNAQQLIPYQAAYAANVITAASWASTGNGQATYTTTSAHGLSVGSVVTIAGIVGSTIPGGYNGDFVCITGTTGSTIVVAMTANPGTATLSGASTLVAGGGALACDILDINTGNSLQVNYDAVNNFVHWNRTGNCALIKI